MPLGSLQDAATSTLPDGEGCVAWSRWRWTWSSSGGCAVGRITRRGKSARKPLAGNPHERFEVAGAGNVPDGSRDRACPRPYLRSTSSPAPSIPGG